MRAERAKLIRKTAYRKSLTSRNVDQYTKLLNSCLALKNEDDTEEMNIEETNRKITVAMEEAESKCQTSSSNTENMLSDETKKLTKKKTKR